VFYIWLLLWIFLCAYFFSGFGLGLFFVLGCGLGFVWLLLWLWERFFNMILLVPSLVAELKVKKYIESVFFFIKTLENTIIQGWLCFKRYCSIQVEAES
jgi:hypothetical protein